MLESKIQAEVVRYAKRKGCLIIKANESYNSHFPDRLFITPDGIYSWIEFKAPGEYPRKAQELMFEKMSKHNNVSVHVIDNVEGGKQLIDEFLTW